MWDGRPHKRHFDEVLARDLDSLADGHRNFLGLPRSEADPTVPVADHYQGREREVLSTLDDLRDAIDMDNLLEEVAVELHIS